jgi:hypothetical protein
MTQYESHLFNELLDVNHEIETGGHSSIVKMALITRYSQIVAQLEDSMGVNEYRNFIGGMRQLFAPAKQDEYNTDPSLSMYIDEEEWERENGR